MKGTCMHRKCDSCMKEFYTPKEGSCHEKQIKEKEMQITLSSCVYTHYFGYNNYNSNPQAG